MAIGQRGRGRRGTRSQATLDVPTLRAMRELLGKTQVEVATAVAMTQAEVSRLERRSDHRVSTLRRVVEALGGELEVTARSAIAGCGCTQRAEHHAGTAA